MSDKFKYLESVLDSAAAMAKVIVLKTRRPLVCVDNISRNLVSGGSRRSYYCEWYDLVNGPQWQKPIVDNTSRVTNFGDFTAMEAKGKLPRQPDVMATYWHKYFNDSDTEKYWQESNNVWSRRKELSRTQPFLLNMLIFSGMGSLDTPSRHTMVETLNALSRAKYCTVLIVAHPSDKLPERLLERSVVVSDALPDRLELAQYVKSLRPRSLRNINGVLQDLTDLQVADCLTGMSHEQAYTAVGRATVETIKSISKVADQHTDRAKLAGLSFTKEVLLKYELEPTPGYLSQQFLQFLQREKTRRLSESRALRLEKPLGVDQIGGLGNLIAWMTRQKCSFSEDAKKAGVLPSKGFLLAGVPGCGKSLAAKVAGGLFGLPVLSLNIGALFQGLVGSSEENLRETLEQIEAQAPCIVCIDEIDKGLSMGGESNGGTGARVLGHILSWLNDRDANKQIFVIATANRLGALPPELLRKGRFDELFSVDLPNPAERTEIFEIHIRNAMSRVTEGPVNNIEGDDITFIVERTEGYVGSEIAAAVEEGQRMAFMDGDLFGGQHILQAIAETQPMSVTNKDAIDAIRAKAKELNFRRATPEYIKPQVKVVSHEPDLAFG